MVIGTLGVDVWAVTIFTARRAHGRAATLLNPLLAVPNITAHTSTASMYQLHILFDVAL